MSYETDTADRYRLRAEALRSIAQNFRDREIAAAVEAVAREYEEMARDFEACGDGVRRDRSVPAAGDSRGYRDELNELSARRG